MKKIISIITMTVSVTIVMAETSLNVDQFQKKLTYFYQAPSEEKFDEIQKAILEFHDSIPKHNRIQIIVWADKVEKKYHWKPLSNFYPKTIQALRDKNSKLVQFVYDDKIISPQKLDIWWASFFATGESDYVRMVFEQAIQLDDKQNLNKILIIKGAAKWSFQSNCKQHAKIRTFARDWLTNKSLNNTSQALLNQCIAN